MANRSKRNPLIKDNLHPRNNHRGRYDFTQLCKSYSPLRAFVSVNQYNDEFVNFSDPEAVKTLNKALLTHFYNVGYWDIPEGYLCPPVPGRADYIHYIADLLNETSIASPGHQIKVLDIGVGANCIYPLIGNCVYGWHFVGADVDPLAIKSAKNIITLNKGLSDKIECRLQINKNDIFKGVIKPGETFDISICNPPFHSSPQEAMASTAKKWDNLHGDKAETELLNFGGQSNELWFAGGEAGFINRMIGQSILVAGQCKWFTTLVSKKDTLPVIYKTLARAGAVDVRTINMAQGQKISRIVAWTFNA